MRGFLRPLALTPPPPSLPFSCLQAAASQEQLSFQRGLVNSGPVWSLVREQTLHLAWQLGARGPEGSAARPGRHSGA